MKRRDIVLGIIVLALAAGAIYFFRQRGNTNTIGEEVIAPEVASAEDTIEDKFKLEIPDDADKAELKDVSGSNSSAIVTRDFSNNLFTLTVLADLSEPEQGSFYQVWIARGSEGEANYSTLPVGRMRVAKGGYLLEFQSKTNYSDYSKIVVTREKTDDSKPETKILEGTY